MRRTSPAVASAKGWSALRLELDLTFEKLAPVHRSRSTWYFVLANTSVASPGILYLLLRVLFGIIWFRPVSDMPKTLDSFDLSGYATVAERIALFYAANPNGRIDTKLVKRENGETIFKASVFRQAEDRFPAATGWAAEKEGDGEINTYACLENTETSAVGRALANLGLTGSTKRASREEMEKVSRAKIYAASQDAIVRTERLQLADALHDLMDLIGDAQTSGFSAHRSQIIRRHFTSCTTTALPRLRRVENRVRWWITRHDL